MQPCAPFTAGSDLHGRSLLLTGYGVLQGLPTLQQSPAGVITEQDAGVCLGPGFVRDPPMRSVSPRVDARSLSPRGRDALGPGFVRDPPMRSVSPRVDARSLSPRGRDARSMPPRAIGALGPTFGRDAPLRSLSPQSLSPAGIDALRTALPPRVEARGLSPRALRPDFRAGDAQCFAAAAHPPPRRSGDPLQFVGGLPSPPASPPGWSHAAELAERSRATLAGLMRRVASDQPPPAPPPPPSHQPPPAPPPPPSPPAAASPLRAAAAGVAAARAEFASARRPLRRFAEADEPRAPPSPPAEVGGQAFVELPGSADMPVVALGTVGDDVSRESVDLLRLCAAGDTQGVAATLRELERDPSRLRRYRSRRLDPLHAACAALHPDPDMVELLLTGALKCSPDARESSLGSTPLHVCAGHVGALSLETADALLRAGAGAASLNRAGESPLHIACKNPVDAQSHSFKNFLVYQGSCPIDVEDQDGNTPLHDAAQEDGRIGVLNWLLEGGADAMHRNARGQTPLDVAQAAGARGCAAALRYAP
eukprot:TRINITY_DN1977_c0_g1_i1.p1 TRINITY_DN1977_c0_g1~~TRINITY_DN1977_c0_g1_i1.p1  ORF type:complete len:537 (+),score=71.93 TRINITY_DN1977_c0_g1_i1:900-2510(+)